MSRHRKEAQKMNYDILLIDGPYLAHRSYCAPFKTTTSTGLQSHAILSFMNTFLMLQKKFQPKRIVVAWESYGTPSWRREIYSTYKPSKGCDSSFIDQTKDIMNLLFALNIPQYNAPNNEADDVIAHFTSKYKDIPTLIYTVDKDLMYLISHNVNIYNGKQICDINYVKKKLGIDPLKIPDLLALVGDKADNIKGIPKYGYKRASKLLQEYHRLRFIPRPTFSEDEWKTLEKNIKITRLNYDCDLILYKPKKEYTIEDICNKYELKNLKEKLMHPSLDTYLS